MKNWPGIIIVLFSVGILFLQACADDSTPETPSMTATTQSDHLPVQDFVRQSFIGGVPYRQTRDTYRESDVPVLLEMLENPAEELYWSNIVIVLNINGSADMAGPIITFINDGSESALSRTHYAAKTSALTSFGYLINRTGSERALTYLIDSLDPEIWQQRPPTGISPFQSTLEETHLELSKNAILGLALSGNSDARDTLQALLDSEPTGQQAVLKANNLETIQEAVLTNRQIAEIGLVEYYSNIQP
jgi:hypothetical protein